MQSYDAPRNADRRSLEQVSPGERIDPEVEEVLLEIAEDFVDNVTNWACQLAKHRKSQTLEVSFKCPFSEHALQ